MMGHTHLHKHLHMYHTITDIPVTKYLSTWENKISPLTFVEYNCTQPCSWKMWMLSEIMTSYKTRLQELQNFIKKIFDFILEFRLV